MKDPYSVLGISKQAKPQEIKAAFRKLAKQYHPDLYPNDKKAKERFAEINQAYEILGDKDKKARYDRGEIDAEGKPKFHGFDPNQGFGQRGFEDRFNFQRRGGARFDASDMFRDLFGRGFADFGLHSTGQSSPRRGEDLKATLSVSLEQIVNKEKVEAAFANGKVLKISLPDYVEDGQVIRLRGQGMTVAGGQAGDALISLHIKKHPKFRLENRALYYDLALPLKDAILGITTPVETLEGRIALRIPAWTSSGRVFRLKGKGLPLKNGGRDDFFVRIEILLPDSDKNALTEFAEKNL